MERGFVNVHNMGKEEAIWSGRLLAHAVIPGLRIRRPLPIVMMPFGINNSPSRHLYSYTSLDNEMG